VAWQLLVLGLVLCLVLGCVRVKDSFWVSGRISIRDRVWVGIGLKVGVGLEYG
jgi:hypothetical protein